MTVNNADVIHWFMTLGMTAFAFILWNMYRDLRTDVGKLTTQNEGQERDIATLKATHDAHASTIDDVKEAIVRVEGKIDGLLARPSDRPPLRRRK